MLLRLQGVAKSIGARALFADVDLQLAAGDRVAVVGPNGAGKSTLLRLVAGEEEPDSGVRSLPRGARVGLLRQEVDPGGEHPVREEAMRALAHLEEAHAELQRLEARMAEAGEVEADLAARWDALHARFALEGGFEREARVERVLEGLGFDAEARERPLRTLSGGWRMRVELAKLLLEEPEILLLDEPTNHLDLPSLEWFDETLAAFPGGAVLVSHDRAFLRRHATRVAELARGRFALTEGGYDRWVSERARRREELLARKATQDRQVAETERFIARFRAKASKARQVQSRVKALEKLERVDVPDETAPRLRLRIPAPPRGGAVPIALEDIHKRYGETVVYAGVDLSLRRGERLALVGPNGAGKSTLLRILAGTLDGDAGTRTLGHRVEVAFYAQHQLEMLDPARSVYEELESVATLEDVPRLRGHLGAFLFSGDDVTKKVSVLSGGEKARLALAKLLLRPANVLVLDEPTNHLDVDACEVLEHALRGYEGTLVFISHDRDFLDALATRVLEVKGGRLREFLGHYSDYRRRLAEEAAGLPAPEPPRRSPDAAAPSPAADTAATGGAAARAPREERRLERERRKTRGRLERRLETQEAHILEAEERVQALGHRLGDPAVYRDGEKVRALEAERSEAREAVATLYREWERIAAELEALDDGG